MHNTTELSKLSVVELQSRIKLFLTDLESSIVIKACVPCFNQQQLPTTTIKLFKSKTLKSEPREEQSLLDKNRVGNMLMAL